MEVGPQSVHEGCTGGDGGLHGASLTQAEESGSWPECSDWASVSRKMVSLG